MEKIKKITEQFVRYFAVALIGYVFDFGLLILLHDILHIHYLLAAAVGFIVGLTVVYILSSRFVFGQSKLSSKSKEFTLFAIIGLIGLGILAGLMWLLVDVMDSNYIVAKVIATIFVYIWNFLARRSLYHD